MATLTEVVAAVVVHSSAAAFSHFGVTLEQPQARAAPAEEVRTIARTPRAPDRMDRRQAVKVQRALCPDQVARAPDMKA
jgi:hypothetical protein